MDENKTLDEQQLETAEQDLTTVDASEPQDTTLSTEDVFGVDESTEEAQSTEAETEEVQSTEAEEVEEVGGEESEGDISFTDFIDNIPQLHRGATVKGVIVRYDDDFVYVDVRDKTEGRIPRREFDMDEELTSTKPSNQNRKLTFTFAIFAPLRWAKKSAYPKRKLTLSNIAIWSKKRTTTKNRSRSKLSMSFAMVLSHLMAVWISIFTAPN